MSPLLNYTTQVPANRTVNEIIAMLAKAGAHSTMARYGSGGRAEAVTFAIDTPGGVRTYAMPIDPAKVLAVLTRDPKVDKRAKTPDQAERVAWRIVKDWLEAQLAIIATEMVTLDQVMLPYMHAEDGRTVYELVRDRQLGLPAAREEAR